VCAKKLVFWRQAAKVAYRIKAGQDDPGRFIMRKLAYACVAIILLAEPALALPVIPMPVAPVLSGGQIVYAAYGHWHRVARRTVRRHHRHYY
jgi:hypothetical protein